VTSTSSELAAFAAVLTREAGELLLEYQLKRRELATETKSSPTDLVSAADRATETLVRKRISERYPTDGMVGEEHESRVGTPGRVSPKK
jgi:myo-inositol-1(or 4)-monophosphatase